MKVINLSEHACNGDRSLCLTIGTRPMSYVGQEIYRAKGGFVACLPDGKCLEGVFETEAAAREAQKEAIPWHAH